MQSDSYSKMVQWLKVLLPLTALALLSTLFLLSRKIDPELSIPFADKEIQDRLRNQIVTGPFYFGTTADGDAIAFSATSLTTEPGTTGVNHAEGVNVVMDTATGSRITLSALTGLFDIAGNSADMMGDVVVITSTGYRVESDRMLAKLSALDVRSPGPVHSVGPVGTLDAGEMVLSSEGPEAAAQLIFTNGVKLVYMPKQDKE